MIEQALGQRVRFYTAEGTDYTRYDGYATSQNMAGWNVLVNADTLLRIVHTDLTDPIGMARSVGQGDIDAWGESLVVAVSFRIEGPDGEWLYPLTDCSFLIEGHDPETDAAFPPIGSEPSKDALDASVDAAATLSPSALIEAAGEARALAEGDTLPFPMPNDRLGERTVVASVEYIDDERGAVALVLLLNPEAPYFTVGHYALTHFTPGPPPKAHGYTSADSIEGYAYKRGEIDVIGDFANIVPAVKAYEENGGDY